MRIACSETHAKINRLFFIVEQKFYSMFQRLVKTFERKYSMNEFFFLNLLKIIMAFFSIYKKGKPVTEKPTSTSHKNHQAQRQAESQRERSQPQNRNNTTLRSRETTL